MNFCFVSSFLQDESDGRGDTGAPAPAQESQRPAQLQQGRGRRGGSGGRNKWTATATASTATAAAATTTKQTRSQQRLFPSFKGPTAAKNLGSATAGTTNLGSSATTFVTPATATAPIRWQH